MIARRTQCDEHINRNREHPRLMTTKSTASLHQISHCYCCRRHCRLWPDMWALAMTMGGAAFDATRDPLNRTPKRGHFINHGRSSAAAVVYKPTPAPIRNGLGAIALGTQRDPLNEVSEQCDFIDHRPSSAAVVVWKPPLHQACAYRPCNETQPPWDHLSMPMLPCSCLFEGNR